MAATVIKCIPREDSHELLTPKLLTPTPFKSALGTVPGT